MGSPSPSDIKRKQDRAPLRIPIYYAKQGQQHQTYSCDICSGGLGMIAEHHLPVGTKTRLRFTHPFLGKIMLYEGEVKWAKPIQIDGHDGEQWAVGIGFSNMDDSDARMMDDLVHDILPPAKPR